MQSHDPSAFNTRSQCTVPLSGTGPDRASPVAVSGYLDSMDQLSISDDQRGALLGEVYGEVSMVPHLPWHVL